MLYKICNYCGKRYPVGVRHECGGRKIHHKSWTHEKWRMEQKGNPFYNSKAWKMVRNAVVARACGLDEYQLKVNNTVEPGEIVHHIKELDENSSSALDMDNLILVSRHTHALIHAQYDKGEDEKRRIMEILRACVR